MRLTRGWRPALRIARREALRARGRSILVLVMIGLPVLGIVALDTLVRTVSVSTVEGLDRTIGGSDALVTYDGSTTAVDQTPDLSSRSGSAQDADPLPTPTVDTVRSVLGRRTHLAELLTGQLAVRTDLGLARPEAVGVDLRDPAAAGLFDLHAGRLPRREGEVVVSERLASRGFPVGSTMTLEAGPRLAVVGIVESTTTRGLSQLVGPVGPAIRAALGDPEVLERAWLVSRPGGVSWSEVRELNTHGMYALSRAVVADPPPASEVTAQDYSGSRVGSDQLAIIGLVVAMALLEVVLLAGPAFAVGARRQQRALALMAAGGAEPPHLRRVVLASGLVLGAAATTLGAVAGVGVAWLARPVVQGVSDTVLGPFEVSLRDTVVVAAAGLVSALLAALFPAVLAARSDVVAVLSGRRGETRPARWSPAIGALLLAAGVAGSAYGALRPGGGEVTIALAAILAVLGTVLVTPLVLGTLGRLAGRLPLPARFAVRDAARHRSRTAPAVAAVAATVAGVVALGIGGTSDAAQNRALYTPTAPMGAGLVQVFSQTPPDWTAVERVVRQQLPGARTMPVRGVQEGGTASYQVDLPVTTADDNFGWASNLGSSLLVGPAALRVLGLTGAELARARDALAHGDVVVFQPGEVTATTANLTVLSYPADGGEATEEGRWQLPATLVSVPGSSQPARAVLPASVARDHALPVRQTALVVTGTSISTTAEDAIDEAVGGLDESASLYVERGFQDDGTRVVLLVLAAIGAVLVLGGTLTATFLALSDARPDFATMGAVGAEPRTRRLVAASYAAVIGLVGAALGAAVGFVPGIAVTYPLTATSWAGPDATTSKGLPLPDHFLDVPWLLVGGLVLLLPLLTAVVVGLGSRSRLPMVSRLS
ncbi:MAG: putative transport system permease protein [Actinomycetota bacterium]|nr:putative transport system permease protein [Actinomycetota bacterium]